MTLLALLLAQVAATTAAPTAEVRAIAETQAVASADDAADDPAIWRDAAHPERSLIVATDKKAGLNVYDLSGKLRSSYPAGRVNNVDLRTVRIDGKPRVIVGASDRNDVAQGKLALFELDPATATLKPLGSFASGAGEAYGFCMYQTKRELYAFVVDKDGTIAQLWVQPSAAGVAVQPVRTMKLQTQSEGCVADDRTGQLYVAEEDVGLWRFDAAPGASGIPTKVASDDNVHLFADAEGVAIAAKGRKRGWLVVSSQGDSAYAVYRLPEVAYVGRFRIAAGPSIGATSETDGIEISTASFGAGREGGLMIAQDGDNSPNAQNFKIVRWKDVAKALGLR